MSFKYHWQTLGDKYAVNLVQYGENCKYGQFELYRTIDLAWSLCIKYGAVRQSIEYDPRITINMVQTCRSIQMDVKRHIRCWHR